MAASEPTPESLSLTLERIDQLIALFNKKGMDLPAGLFDRKSQFLLNGAAYETLLGRSASEPLIMMLARGPSGYRFITKALQHAVPDATVERGDLTCDQGTAICHIDLWLSGHVRGTGEPIHSLIRVVLAVSHDGCIEKAEAAVDEPALERLRAARHRA